MFGLGGGKPRYCVKFGAHAVAWGERSRNWRGRYSYRCVVLPIPAGAAKLSPIEPNISDHAALEEHLRTLAGPGKSLRLAGRVLIPQLPRAVTLLIPDLAVRMTVLSLDQLPSQKPELEALIRWRLGQEQQFPQAGTKLAWQVFPPAHGEKEPMIVLVAAIQHSILTQYESLCESVGLLPQGVHVSSADVFNLWFRVAGGYRRFARDLACLTVLDGALTCIVFHRGRPIFVRTKLLGIESGGSTDDGAAADRILDETAASLLACRERHPGVDVKEIVLMAEIGGRRVEDLLANELGATVDRLAWDHVRALGWKPGGGTTSAAALPVVAAMV
ncbi:MAG TPA: hypothetical protein VJ746_19240 [Nitrospira sp.]|nr:hypothetical protein [Nitrospira sp.]